ncbi:MAG: cellulose binding domain-containing protein, partial [Saprospiraceae bacterium]|nr:cellulose binding domain-containing protein [Saprospiraceae bacterium]
ANATFVCDNPFSAQVTLKNFGMSTLTSVTINYKINNGAPVSQNWNGSLVQNATANVVLNNITPPGNGAFVLSVYTSNPNGMMDASPANDTSKANLQYLMSTNLPYAQDFAAGIPGNISISDPSSDGFKWKYNPNVNGFGAASGGGSLWLDNYNDNTSGTLDYAFLPNLSLAGQQNTQLQFDVAYAKYDDNNIDSLLVAVSSDCRNNFLAVYKKGGADLATAPDQTNLFIPTAMQWRTETIDLSAYDGNGNLSIVFINKGGWGQALYVDNIQINGVAVAAYQNLTSMQQFTNLPNAITNANPGETIQQINNAVEFAPIELPLGYIFDFQQPYTLEIKIP